MKKRVTDHELILAFYPGASALRDGRRFNVIWKKKGNAGYGSEYFGAENIKEARFIANEWIARFNSDACRSTVKVSEVTAE